MKIPSKAQRRRIYLRHLSDSMREGLKPGEFYSHCHSVNEAIREYYKLKLDAKELHTFEEWQERGRGIKRGSEPFCIWGKPAEKQRENNDAFTYYPVVYLYDIKQTYTITNR